MMALIFAGVGAMGLLLSVAGLYAVMAFSVTQRTREIGLRVALGATPLGVMRAVLGGGLRQVGIGLVLGSIAGVGVLELLSVFPIGFASGGAGLLVVALVLLAAGVTACSPPRGACGCTRWRRSGMTDATLPCAEAGL
ncbi:MAG TPA: FtsX-like permease family protein [Thermoanaerobaculia bacterium]|nr:FtsX-like permease family protein [Thermoanaerobaculia bacterium]